MEDWTTGLADAHCHPTDNPESLDSIPSLRAAGLTIMSTSFRDMDAVADAARKYPDRVIPSFGVHPWFSWEVFDDRESPDNGVDQAGQQNTISPPRLTDRKMSHYQSILVPEPDPNDPDDAAILAALPVPIPLSWVISTIESHLNHFPHALIGEIGIDKPFRVRIPNDQSAAGRAEGKMCCSDTQESGDKTIAVDTKEEKPPSPLRRQSRFRVSIPHQRTVFAAQLDLAARTGRAVSVHGVQAQQAVYESVRDMCAQNRDNNNATHRTGDKDDRPARVCLHSFSGHGQSVLPFLKLTGPSGHEPETYFSFSPAVNLAVVPDGETNVGDMFGIDPVDSRKEKDDSDRAGDTKTEETAAMPTEIDVRKLPTKLVEAIRTVPDNRILVESDLPSADHRIDRSLELMARVVCAVKGWNWSHGVGTIQNNWHRFVGKCPIEIQHKTTKIKEETTKEEGWDF